MAKRTYISVPADEAKNLLENYDKDMVVILAWDMENEQLHTTTSGRDDHFKEYAAAMGDLLPTLIGADITKAKTFEDFRGEWIIWSIEHGGYWAPNHRGYVKLKSEAGRYSYREALKIVRGANAHRGDNQAPYEAMIQV